MKRAKSLVGVLLVLVMVGSVVSSAMAVNTVGMKPIIATERSELHKNINIVKVDPALKNATPYWIIIVAGSTEKGRSATFKYIDSSTNLTKKEKAELKKFVKELWRKYRVKTIKSGNVTLITLGSKTEINLTKEEEIMLDKITQAVNEYFRAKYSGDVGILWNVDTHQDIIYIACKKGGENEDYCKIARDHAGDPDTWGQPPYFHYYNPDYNFGLAPANCDNYAEHAKVDYSAGYYELAFEELGWASHYLTDVGNPLHTGREGDQVLHRWVHTAYENYVSNNWIAGYNFKSIIDNNWYYYQISDPEKAAKSLASYSHQYVDTLYFKIYNNPDNFQNDQDVKNITENCLLETAKWTLGLVKYVRG